MDIRHVGGRGLLGWAAWLSCALAFAAPAAIKPPAWVDAIDVPAVAEHAASDRVVLLLDNQLSLLGDEPERYYRRVSLVRTAAGIAPTAELSVDYDPAFATADVHAAWVTRDGVRSDRLASARIETLRREQGLDAGLLDGRLTLHVVLDDVRVGDIVEYAVSVRGDNPVHNGNVSQFEDFSSGLPVQLRRFRLLRPTSETLARNIVGEGLEYTQRVVDGTVDERWQRRDVTPLRNEERTPDWYSDGPRIELGSMEAWSDVVDWALPLYAGIDPAAVAALAKDLGIEAGRADESGILAAIRFVQDDIRYTGLELGAHAYAPYPVDEVLRRRYGDCKDKAQMLTALLRHMGMDAAPALVNSTLLAHVRDRLPSAHVFDHVIVRFEHEGREYWVDATASRQRGDLAHLAQAEFGSALLIASGESALRTMPVADSDVPRIEIDEVIDLRGDDGTLAEQADYRITTLYRGRDADRVRNTFSADTPESIGAGYTEWVGHYYPGAVMLAPPTTSDDPVTNTLTVQEHYRIDDVWKPDSDADNGAKSVTFWLGELHRAFANPPAGQRRTPWEIGRRLDIRQSVTVHLDQGWPEADVPTTVQTAHVDYSGRIANSGNTLRMDGRLRMPGGSVPAAEVADLRRKLAAIDDAVGYTLTFTPESDTGSGSATAPAIDWRLGVLGVCIVLLWTWVVSAFRSRSVSVRWGMWFRPTATVRAGLAVWRPVTAVLLFAASGVAGELFDPETMADWSADGLPFGIGMLVIVVLLQIAFSWIYAALLGWVGRCMGGQGSTRDTFVAVAWANMPMAATLPLALIALALYGRDGMQVHAWAATTPMVLLWMGAYFPMALWATVIWFPSFAAAQRMTVARAIWTSMLAGLGLAAVIGAVVIAWNLLAKAG